MIHVDQTKFGDKNGNCLAACLASILECQLSDVPDFGDGKGWYLKLTRWLKSRNFILLYWGAPEPERPEAYHLTLTKPPRGKFLHWVVVLGNNIVHDPHPSRDGLAGPVEDTMPIVPVNIVRSTFWR